MLQINSVLCKLTMRIFHEYSAYSKDDQAGQYVFMRALNCCWMLSLLKVTLVLKFVHFYFL